MKRKNRSISHAEEIQIIYVYTPPSRGKNTNFLLLKCRLYTVTSFQNAQYGKVWGGSIFTVETPNKHCPGQVIKAIIIINNKSWGQRLHLVYT